MEKMFLKWDEMEWKKRQADEEKEKEWNKCKEKNLLRISL